jgi:hypothetical protein
MTNKELQELLKQYPDDSKINIHIDAETCELCLCRAWTEYDEECKILLLAMSAEMP